jgi:hypothetical protein
MLGQFQTSWAGLVASTSREARFNTVTQYCQSNVKTFFRSEAFSKLELLHSRHFTGDLGCTSFAISRAKLRSWPSGVYGYRLEVFYIYDAIF